ncbi:MAG TPA: DNA polymerase III subunit delta [Candidatus Acidoferrum sp.]|nr:DNA polymerase III subunit delta [Candidatus Acidoferrum sp.]
MVSIYTGANNFLLRQSVDKVVLEFVQKFGSHTVEKFDAAEVESNQLGELLQSTSLFADERLVVIDNVSTNKALWEALETWIDRVPSQTTLLLIEPTPDKRTKTYKLLVQYGAVREFGELSDADLNKWMRDAVAAQGGVLDVEVAGYLLKTVGTDQWRLWQELQKLLSYNPIISKQAIDELVELTPQATAFELLDAVMNHKLEQINRLLESVAANEDPYKFMGLLISQIHALAVVKAAAGKTVDEMAKDSGLHPFVLRKTQLIARSMALQKLYDSIKIVARCDEQLKSTGAEPWFLIGQCLQRLAQ